jgi:hypothetical protein
MWIGVWIHVAQISNKGKLGILSASEKGLGCMN